MRRISRAIAVGAAAISLAASVVMTAEPAAAQWHGGGGGGWHGGGWGGGGWHGGGWHGGWAGGPGYRWHNGYWNGGTWNNGWWAPAVVAGLATGAIIATAPGWGGGNCWQNRPVYDGYGNWLGNRNVNVCQ